MIRIIDKVSVAMKHIIFGGLGFTGQQLVTALLRAREQVLVCDLAESAHALPGDVQYFQADICAAHRVAAAPISPGDVVYQLAARQYHMPVPKDNRDAFFSDVNANGTRNVLDAALRRGASGVVFFSTDMVYGIPDRTPVERTHPRRPLGPYGRSKLLAEEACAEYRRQGLNVTILRPRLILGPGRMGVLAKLFRLIRKGFPVPLIGSGANRYQMVSVFDCVTAALRAVSQGIPNSEFNLGSANPPLSRDLLATLIEKAGSRSILVKTPSGLMKAALGALDRLGLTMLYPEQFLIADIDYIVDTSATEAELGWIAEYSDEDMILAAYDEYLRRDSRTP